MAAAKAPALTATIIAACEGAVVLARAERSFEPFDMVAEELIESVRNASRRRRP